MASHKFSCMQIRLTLFGPRQATLCALSWTKKGKRKTNEHIHTHNAMLLFYVDAHTALSMVGASPSPLLGLKETGAVN